MARTPAWAALALIAASLLVCELALEALFVPALPLLPRKLHVYLGEAIRPLAQSSKRGARPHDYVALVGDSYAQGAGDWLLDSDGDRNGPYASAHVLHERTGRDVVSFARGGAGAIAGWIAYPRITLAAPLGKRCKSRPRMRRRCLRWPISTRCSIGSCQRTVAHRDSVVSSAMPRPTGDAGVAPERK